MNGINLHHIVRAPITNVHPDETLLWYQNQGAQNVGGILKPSYAAPLSRKCRAKATPR